MGYPNVMKEIGTATLGLPLVGLALDRILSTVINTGSVFPEEVRTTGLLVATTGVALSAWAGCLLWKVGGISLRLGMIWKGNTSNPWRLVTHGPYRATRNPLMVGDILLLLGLGLAFNSLMLIALTSVWGAYMHHKITQYEETNLLRRFGKEYEAYCQRVGRWLPTGLLRKAVPASEPHEVHNLG